MIEFSAENFITTLINIITDSPTSILFIILGIIFTVAMIINVKKNKTIGKSLFIIGWVFIVLFIIIKYNGYISKLFDNLVNNVFMQIFFPNLATYIIIIIITNIIFLRTILNKKTKTFSKIINSIFFSVIMVLMVYTLDLIIENKINIYEKAELYTNKQALTLIEATTIIFSFWMILIFSKLAIKKLVNKSNEKILKENEKAETSQIATEQAQPEIIIDAPPIEQAVTPVQNNDVNTEPTIEPVPEPTLEVTPEPVMTAEPLQPKIVETPTIEPTPVIEQTPVTIPEPITQPEIVTDTQPIEQAVTPVQNNDVYTEPTIEPAPEPILAVTPEPVVVTEPIQPEIIETPTIEPEPAPVIEQTPVTIPEPITQPEIVTDTQPIEQAVTPVQNNDVNTEPTIESVPEPTLEVTPEPVAVTEPVQPEIIETPTIEPTPVIEQIPVTTPEPITQPENVVPNIFDMPISTPEPQEENMEVLSLEQK